MPKNTMSREVEDKGILWLNPVGQDIQPHDDIDRRSNP